MTDLLLNLSVFLIVALLMLFVVLIAAIIIDIAKSWFE